MGPVVSGRGLCDIERVLFRVAKSLVKKLFLHEENIPIISKIEKPKLSLDFCLTRTLNKLATFNKTLDITQFASAGYQTPTKYRSHGISSNYRDSATLNFDLREGASKIFAGNMEDDDMEIDINKILADAEEKSKLAAKEFDKTGDSITKKFSLDENYSFSVYDYQGLFFMCSELPSRLDIT